MFCFFLVASQTWTCYIRSRTQVSASYSIRLFVLLVPTVLPAPTSSPASSPEPISRRTAARSRTPRRRALISAHFGSSSTSSRAEEEETVGRWKFPEWRWVIPSWPGQCVCSPGMQGMLAGWFLRGGGKMQCLHQMRSLRCQTFP